MYGPYNHGWMFDGGVGMLFGGLWMILFLVVPLLLLAVLLKYLFTKSRAAGTGKASRKCKRRLMCSRQPTRAEKSVAKSISRNGTTSWKSRLSRCFKPVSGPLPQGSDTWQPIPYAA